MNLTTSSDMPWQKELINHSQKTKEMFLHKKTNLVVEDVLTYPASFSLFQIELHFSSIILPAVVGLIL